MQNILNTTTRNDNTENYLNNGDLSTTKESAQVTHERYFVNYK